MKKIKKNWKRYSCFSLILVLLLTSINWKVLANAQDPVIDAYIAPVNYVLGRNIATNETIIYPTMTANWTPRPEWATPTAVNHAPKYYTIDVKNLSLGTQTQLKVEDGGVNKEAFAANKIKLEDQMQLQTGSIYEIGVLPYHFHTDPTTGLDTVLVTGTGIRRGYAATELDVKLTATGDEITVGWQDMGFGLSGEEINYRVLYKLGDHSGKKLADMEKNPLGDTIVNSKSVDVISGEIDKDDGRHMLYHKIGGDFIPGLLYSVMVFPTNTKYGSSGETFAVNRNDAIVHTVSTELNLSISEFSPTEIRLEWSIPESLLIGSRGTYQLVEAKLRQYTSAGDATIATLKPGAAGIGRYVIDKPDVTTQYQLFLTVGKTDGASYILLDDDEQPESKRAEYAPESVFVAPSTPTIPKLYSESNMINDLVNNVSSGDSATDTAIVNRVKAILEQTKKDNAHLGAYGLAKKQLENLYADNIIFNGGTISNSTINDIAKSLLQQEKYLLKGDTSAGIVDMNFANRAENLYTFDSTKPQINLVWSSFRRKETDPKGPKYGKPDDIITDYDTYYDITITDAYESLAIAEKVAIDKQFSAGATKELVKDTAGEVIGYTMDFTEYYDTNEKTMKTLQAGKIYYIRVVAKKKSGDDIRFSEPVVTTLYYFEDGDNYSPPLLAEPPLRELPGTTATSATLGWREKWMEVLDLHATPTDVLSQWRSQVFIDNTSSGFSMSKNIYKEEPDISEIPSGAKILPPYEFYKDNNVFATFKTDLKARLVADVDTRIINREVNFGTDVLGASNISYKYHQLEYAAVKKILDQRGITFNQYFVEIINKDKAAREAGETSNPNLISWVDIKPTKNPKDSNELIIKRDSLLPNTMYIMIIYPIRTMKDGTVVYANVPTPIIVATKPDSVTVEPSPDVPNLYVTDEQQMDISVAFKYNHDFTYEISYGKEDDPSKGENMKVELPKITNPSYPKAGDYYRVKVADLFPNTGYYFHVRATSKANGTSSAWSTGVFGETLDVDKPVPPEGIGVASTTTIKKHKIEKAVDSKHIVVEWLSHPDDKGEDTSTGEKVKKEYSYVIEVANNAQFIDPQYIVSGDTESIEPNSVKLLEKTVLQANELVPNRPYYFRLKTRVTVTGSNGEKPIVKESESYSKTIRVLTVPSQDEYDASKDPALEILPGKDYENRYDGDTQEVIFRFRDRGTSADGAADNGVAQRLISDLIIHNMYEYEIDLTKFDNKPISRKKIEIPYTVVEAFDKYAVDLLVDTGELEVVIPLQALTQEVERQKRQYGVAPKILMTFENVDAYYDRRKMPEEALNPVGVPQEIEVKVYNDRLTRSVDYTAEPITVYLDMGKDYNQAKEKPVIYSLNTKNRWEEIEGTYDPERNAYKVETQNLGAVGAYLLSGSTEVKPLDFEHWSDVYRKQLDDSLTILGLEWYEPSDKVSENEVLNATYYHVTDAKKIDLKEPINNSKMNALIYSGIMESASKDKATIDRQKVISMMMRASDKKANRTDAYYTRFSDKKAISKGSISIEQTIMNDAGIDAVYKQDIIHAVKAGILSDPRNIRGKDDVKYGEFLAIWARVKARE